MAGAGSALHHWLPKHIWTHAADFATTNLLACSTFTYAAHVLAGCWCVRRRGSQRGDEDGGASAARASEVALARTQNAALLCGTALATISVIVYARRWQWPRVEEDITTILLIALIGSIVICHAALIATLAWSLHKKGWLARGKSIKVVAQAYGATVVGIAVAVPAQRIEHTGCPAWLFDSGVSVHAIWHLAIFFCVYNANEICLYIDTRSAVVRCAPWLMLRVALADDAVAKAEDDARERRAERIRVVDEGGGD